MSSETARARRENGVTGYLQFKMEVNVGWGLGLSSPTRSMVLLSGVEEEKEARGLIMFMS